MRCNDRLFPLTQVFYRPGGDPHTRMKYAIKRIGRWSCDAVRPLKPVDEEKRTRIDRVLEEGGLSAPAALEGREHVGVAASVEDLVCQPATPIIVPAQYYNPRRSLSFSHSSATNGDESHPSRAVARFGWRPCRPGFQQESCMNHVAQPAVVVIAILVVLLPYTVLSGDRQPELIRVEGSQIILENDLGCKLAIWEENGRYGLGTFYLDGVALGPPIKAFLTEDNTGNNARDTFQRLWPGEWTPHFRPTKHEIVQNGPDRGVIKFSGREGKFDGDGDHHALPGANRLSARL